MLYKDRKVLIPDKVKVQRKENHTYVSIVIGTKYDPKKQYNIDKRACIGRAVDSEYMNPNDNYYKYVDIGEIEPLDEPVLSNTLKVGNTLVINKIINDLSIKQILEEVFDDNADLIQDLISYITINATSIMQHFPDYAWNHITEEEKLRSDSYISEFLSKVMSKDDVRLFIEKWNKENNVLDEIVISYDSTNMNTEAIGIDMAEYGHAKDNSDLPQVNLSYVINQENATPLFYELYPGSIIDNSQCKYMVDKAIEYGYKRITFILDRGYFSHNNISYFDTNNYDFIMMVKDNSKMIQEKIKVCSPLLRNDINTFIVEFDVYGTTVKDKLYSDDKKQRYFHIYYDSTRAENEKKRLIVSYRKMEEQLEKKVNEKIVKENELNAYKKAFNLYFDDNGYLLRYKMKPNYINEQISKLGYFVIITSKEMSAYEAINTYRNRDEVEKIFRTIKTGFGYSSPRVHSQASLENKTFLIFMASIIRNEISKKNKPLLKLDKKNFTTTSCINHLERIEVTKNANGIYKRNYSLTSIQKKILNQFGIDEKYLDMYVDNYKK